MEEQHYSIGSLLKTNRKKKQLTLEQVNQAIKIRVNILKDLEADNFEKLGGKGYAKAMIMNYAKFLGIEQSEILKMVNDKFNTKTQYQRHDRSIQPKKLILPGNIFAIIALVVMIIILTFLVIHLFKTGVLTWPPFKNVEKEVQVNKVTPKKEKVVEPPSKIEMLKQSNTEASETDKLVIDRAALRDTTDHLDELLFKNKQSPLNYEPR